MDKKDKLDFIKNFSELFDFKVADNNEDIIPEGERNGYMDSRNIMMVIPKLYSVKKIIDDSFDVVTAKVPKLNYKVHMVNGGDDKIKVYSRMMGETTAYEENSACFSPEYLKIIAKLCSKTKSKNVIIKLRKFYPMWLETDEVICIIAPRDPDMVD